MDIRVSQVLASFRIIYEYLEDIYDGSAAYYFFCGAVSISFTDGYLSLAYIIDLKKGFLPDGYSPDCNCLPYQNITQLDAAHLARPRRTLTAMPILTKPKLFTPLRSVP